MRLLLLVQRLRLEQLYLPVLLPNFRVASLQVTPELTEQDELAVQNVTQLINFLTGGSGTLSLRSMTPNVAREVFHDLHSVISKLCIEKEHSHTPMVAWS